MGVAGIIFEPHPPNFEIYTTFKDVQMMLKIFFLIFTGFRFSKISVECSVHLCSCPCVNSQKKILSFVCVDLCPKYS